MSTLATSKLDLSEPDKFQMASIVVKNSRTGFTSNKRLLAIRKGYLYYYSNVPKKFKGDATILQTIHELPKCSIQIVNIKQIKGFQSNSSYFSIQFQAKNMLEREDIRKTMTLQQYNFSPKNTKQNIVWQFTCDNQFIKQRWVAALEGLHAYYSREKKDIQKFFNENKITDNNSEMKSSSSGGRNSQVPWRQSQSFNKKPSGNQISYLQLVSTKSQDKINSSNPLQQNKKPSSSNYLQVINPNNANMSRGRGISANNQQPKTNNNNTFMKQYSPVQSRNPSSSNILQQSIQPPSQQEQEITSSYNYDRKLQNSPINNLQLSGMNNSNGNSPPKINRNNKMMFSKTQPVVISQQIIQQSQNQSLKTPAETPIKNSQYLNVNLDQRQADDFQIQILQSQMKSINQAQSKIGKGLFNEINLQKQNSKKSQERNKKSQSEQKQNYKTNSQQKGTFENIFNSLNNQKPQIKKTPSSVHKQHSQQQQSISTIINQNFYNLHRHIFRKSLPFTQKIQIQKHFIEKANTFTSISLKTITSYIDSLSDQNRRQSSNFKTIFKTNNLTILNHIPSKTFFKIAFVTSQSLLINGCQKIYFDQQSIKNLKREFKVYNDLEKYIVLQNLKNDQQFKLRVPLCVFIEYKGVAVLAIDQSYVDQDLDQQQLDHSNKNFNNHQMLKKQFAKQTDTIINQGYEIEGFKLTINNKDNYLFISLLYQFVANRMCKDEVKKKYLKNIIKVKRHQKHHNIELNPPFTQQLITKAYQSNASTSIQSLEQYISTLTKIPQFKGICPKQQIIEIMKICVFCKQIRKLYRSAQGQIQETHFLNLIFKNDPSLMKILNDSGCDEIPQLKGILFTFIKHYLGINCTINQKVLIELVNKSKREQVSSNKQKLEQDIILSTQIYPKILTYSFQKLQIQQAYQSLKKFISQQKISLAQQTLQTLQSLHLQEQYYSSSTNPLLSDRVMQKKLQLTYLKSSLAYLEHDYLKCIQLCKEYQKTIFQSTTSSHSPKLFYIYLLMMKSYSHFSQQQFKITLQKIIKLIEINYGKNNSVLISVYCITAYYFSVINKKKQPQSRDFIVIQLFCIKLLEQALALSLQHFGEESNQYVDILIDLGKICQMRDKEKSKKYTDRARTIVISRRNYQKQIDLSIHQIKQLFNQRKLQLCEKLIDEAEQLIVTNKVKVTSDKLLALMRLKFDVGFASDSKNYLCQRAIQNLWHSNPTLQSKDQSIMLSIKLLKKLKLIPTDQSEQSFLYSNLKNSSQLLQQNSLMNSDKLKTDQQMLNRINQELEEGNYGNDEEPLISRIKEILQDDDEIKEWVINKM